MDSTPYAVAGNRLLQIVFNCLFCIGIILSNFLLIAAVLLRKDLRQNSKYILAALLAATDLYLGLFELPVATNNMVTQTWNMSCTESLVLQGSGYVKITMSCLAIVSIDIDTIMQISYKMYKGTFRVVCTIILALFFIGGPLIVLVPIFVNGKSSAFVGSCLLSLELPYARAANVMSYWVPSALIIVTTIIVIVVHQGAKRRNLQNNDQTLPGGTNLADLVAAAVVTVSLNLPTYALSLAGCALGICDWYFILVIVFGYVSEARAIIVPLLWFANKDFLNTVLRRRTSNKPTTGQSSYGQPYNGHPPYGQPPYAQSPYAQPAYGPPSYDQQYMTSPVVGQTYQNSGFQDSVPTKQ